jgi:hypothetical protein
MSLLVADNRFVSHDTRRQQQVILIIFVQSIPTCMHTSTLHNLYFLLNIIRMTESRIRWAGHVTCIWEKRNAYTVLVRKPGGKRLLGRPRCRWEDNIKMDLREKGWGTMHWIHLAKDTDQRLDLVNTVMNLQVPQNAGICLSSWVTGGFSKTQYHGSDDRSILYNCVPICQVNLIFHSFIRSFINPVDHDTMIRDKSLS